MRPPLHLRPFEELTLNTAPTLREAFINGWVARASGTETRRSNAATCLYRGGVAFERTYPLICDWYARYQQPAAFRLTELAPESVDPFLEAEGYVRDAPTFFMLLPLTKTTLLPVATLIPGTRIAERALSEGLADLHHMKGLHSDIAALEISRQALWQGQQRFIALKSINGIAAVGLARKEGNYVGIFNMHTAPSQRGKGYASLVLAHLLAWAKESGASHAFLQVECSNVRAQSIYERVGFRSQYSYWYRVQAK